MYNFQQYDYRDSEWHTILSKYLDVLEYWNIQIDHEDGSTAPFSTLAMEEVCSK